MTTNIILSLVSVMILSHALFPSVTCVGGRNVKKTGSKRRAADGVLSRDTGLTGDSPLKGVNFGDENNQKQKQKQTKQGVMEEIEGDSIIPMESEVSDVDSLEKDSSGIRGKDNIGKPVEDRERPMNGTEGHPEDTERHIEDNKTDMKDKERQTEDNETHPEDSDKRLKDTERNREDKKTNQEDKEKQTEDTERHNIIKDNENHKKRENKRTEDIKEKDQKDMKNKVGVTTHKPYEAILGSKLADSDDAGNTTTMSTSREFNSNVTTKGGQINADAKETTASSSDNDDNDDDDGGDDNLDSDPLLLSLEQRRLKRTTKKGGGGGGRERPPLENNREEEGKEERDDWDDWEDNMEKGEYSHEKPEVKKFITVYSKLLENIYNRPSVKYQVSPFDYNEHGRNLIAVHFTPFKILSVDEREQSVSIASYLVIKWNDDALRWKSRDFRNITTLHLRTSKIWTPSILIPRANGEGAEVTMPTYAKVSTKRRNNIKMSILIRFKTSCELDLSMYPFDQQKCSILFRDENGRPMSITDPDEEVVNDVLQQYASTSGEWEIRNVTSSAIRQNVHKQSVDAVEFVVYMSRRSTYYVANLLIPLHMTSFVALFVFWIPPETGEKISFMVSIYVSTSLFLTIVNDVLPRSLISLPSFNVIIVLINAQIALTFIASLLVLRQYRNQLQENADYATAAGSSPYGAGVTSGSTTSLEREFPKAATKGVRRIKINSVAAVDNMDSLSDPMTYHLPDVRNCHRIRRGGVSWLDYQFLDKMFFVIFSVMFLVIMFIPWLCKF